MNHETSPSSPPRLRVEGLSKSFSGVCVVDRVGFDAWAGEVLGVVGENGSGKSTTMNIVAGILTADEGRIRLDDVPYRPANRRESDAAGVAFIQQELSIFPNLSVEENLFLCHNPRAIAALPVISGKRRRTRAAELLRAVDLEVAPEAKASALSTGERQQLEIARGLAVDSRVMIFDEPTSSLSRREAERLFEIIARLKKAGVAIIFISHTLEDVLRLSDRLVVMRDGRVVLQTPNHGVTVDQLVEAMVGSPLGALFPTRPSRPVAAPLVLEANGVGEPGVVDSASIRVGQGELVGISGLMGSGRTELARILFGLDGHRTGSIQASGRALASGDLGARLRAGWAFLTEDRRHEGLMMDASVAENMELAALPLFARGCDGRVRMDLLTDAMRGLAGKLDLRCGDLKTVAARTLSGGNQQKVVLGRWLLRQPSLFILDEPTRGVDVGAKAEIYHLLAQMAEAGMGVLIISSEIEELIGLCDRIVVMRLGRLGAEFERASFDHTAILRAAFGQEDAG